MIAWPHRSVQQPPGSTTANQVARRLAKPRPRLVGCRQPPLSDPAGGAACPCHPGRLKATPTCFFNFFLKIHIVLRIIFVPSRGIKPCRLYSMLSWLVGCHTGAVGPAAPQAPATGWLGLATPVWPTYEETNRLRLIYLNYITVWSLKK